MAWLACWASAAAAVWLAWQFAVLLAVLGGVVVAGTAGIYLAVRKWAMPRVGVVYRAPLEHQWTVLTGPPKAVPAPSQPATLHWTVTEQVIER